jgi:UPF0716 protein FxsA
LAPVVALLALLFLAVPFAELFVIIKVGQAIGVLWTIVLLVGMSALGAALVKREGLAVWRRAQERLQHGEVPGEQLIDGVLVLFAGALLLTPGFLSDLVGLLLLLPPVRFGLRRWARGRLQRRVQYP